MIANDFGERVIIGIDPGATSGWAVLSVEANPQLVLYGSFVWPKPGTKKDIPANTPSAKVEGMIEAMTQTGCVIVGAAVEDHYLSRSAPNPDSMKKLARNGGRWEESFRRLGISVEWVNPQSWQSAELGTCRLDRAEVKRRCARKVRGLWNEKMGEDAADAALIGRYAAIRKAFAELPRRAK